MKKATLHTDGGARGNPGPAGIGFVLKITGHNQTSFGDYIGETTNNQAEYQALVAGLNKAFEEGVAEIDCFLDSELVVKQLGGQYRVKDQNIKPLHQEVCKLLDKFDRVTFTHIPRAKNQAADKLVNQAIDRAT